MPRPRKAPLNPHLETMPNFGGPGYNRTRAQKRQELQLSNDEVINLLQNQWTIEHNIRIAQWDIEHPQLEQDNNDGDQVPQSHQNSNPQNLNPSIPSEDKARQPQIEDEARQPQVINNPNYPNALSALATLLSSPNPYEMPPIQEHSQYSSIQEIFPNMSKGKKCQCQTTTSSEDSNALSDNSVSFSSESSLESKSKKKQSKLKSIKIGRRLFDLDKADYFILYPIMENL